MPLSDPILAGEQLIPSGIRSANYVPGTTGWRIAKDGSAEFYGVTIRADLQSSNYVAGTAGWRLLSSGDAELNDATVRGTLRSPGYTAGVDGWTLNEAGDAELNELVARGSIATASPGQARVLIDSSAGAPPPAGVGLVEFYSARPEEDEPGRVRSYGIGGPPTMFFEGPDAGFGIWSLAFPSDGPAVLTAGGNSTDVVLSGAQLYIPDAPDVTVESGGGLVIGDWGSGQSIAIDANEIMARDASVFPAEPGTLNLQNNGGVVAFGGGLLGPDMRARDVVDGGTRSTSSTSFVFPAGSVADFTFPYPPSGVVTVTLSTRLQLASTAAGQTAVLSFEIRDTNAAGALRFAASDNNSCAVRGTAGGVPFPASRTRVADGLPTSGTGYIRAMLRTTDAANAASCVQTNLTIQPSP